MITGAAGGIGAAISEGWPMPERKWPCAAGRWKSARPWRIGSMPTAARPALTIWMCPICRRLYPVWRRLWPGTGKIDVLFNVAGINKREGLLDVEEETYDRIMNTNLKGVYFVTQAVAGRCTSAEAAASSTSVPTTIPPCWAAARSTARPKAASLPLPGPWRWSVPAMGFAAMPSVPGIS